MRLCLNVGACVLSLEFVPVCRTIVVCPCNAAPGSRPVFTSELRRGEAYLLSWFAGGRRGAVGVMPLRRWLRLVLRCVRVVRLLDRVHFFRGVCHRAVVADG